MVDHPVIVYVQHTLLTYTPYYPPRNGLFADAAAAACTCKAFAAALAPLMGIMRQVIDRILMRWLIPPSLTAALYGEGYRGREKCAFAYALALCGWPSTLPMPLRTIYYRGEYCFCCDRDCCAWRGLHGWHADCQHLI